MTEFLAEPTPQAAPFEPSLHLQQAENAAFREFLADLP